MGFLLSCDNSDNTTFTMYMAPCGTRGAFLEYSSNVNTKTVPGTLNILPEAKLCCGAQCRADSLYLTLVCLLLFWFWWACCSHTWGKVRSWGIQIKWNNAFLDFYLFIYFLEILNTADGRLLICWIYFMHPSGKEPMEKKMEGEGPFKNKESDRLNLSSITFKDQIRFFTSSRASW